MNNIYKEIVRQDGHSIVEMIMALGIFALLLSFMFVPAMQGITSLERSSYYMQALAYLNEGESALRQIEKTNWNTLVFSQSGVSTSTGVWSLVGEGSNTNLGNFYRTIDFSNIYRDDNHLIVAEGAASSTLDNLSKYADIRVSWEVPGQNPIAINKNILLTNYND